MSAKNISPAQNTRKRSVDTPFMVALFIVVISIIILSVWTMFFDTSIKGSWRLSIKDDSGDSFYELNFKDNNEFDYSFGGVTYSGRYTLDIEQNSLALSSSSYGKYNLNSRFNYQVNGISFGKRELLLYTADNDELSFLSSDNYVPVIKYYSDFSPNEKLLGSWLYKDNEQGYNYTFTFFDDGRYEYLCSGSRHIGAYKTNSDKFTYNLIVDNNTVNEETMTYSVTDGKLTLISGDFSDTLTKTDNKFSFENEIK